MSSLIFGSAIGAVVSSFLYHHSFEIIVCEETQTCERALQKLLAQNPSFIGLDCEWKPARKKKESHPVALMQLCFGNLCVIIRMLELDGFPHSLTQILESKSIIKCGIGIDGDAKKLFRDHDLITNEYLDIRFAYKHLYNEVPRKSGLAALSALILHRKLPKEKHIVRSDWSAPLSQIQIEYASQDAKASFDLLSALIRFGCKREDLDQYTNRTFKVKHSRVKAEKQTFQKQQRKKQIERNNLGASIELWKKEYREFVPGDLVEFCNEKLQDGYESFHKFMVSEEHIAIFKSTKRADGLTSQTRKVLAAVRSRFANIVTGETTIDELQDHMKQEGLELEKSVVIEEVKKLDLAGKVFYIAEDEKLHQIGE